MRLHLSLAVHHPKLVFPIAAAFLLPVLATTGCGSRNSIPLAPVRGTVSYQGKLLERGQVVFMPEPGTPGPPAFGEIQPDGSYELKTGKSPGAPIGRHRVLVNLRRQPTEAEKMQFIRLKSLIPEKYSRDGESPLRFEVKPGVNEYSIVLE